MRSRRTIALQRMFDAVWTERVASQGLSVDKAIAMAARDDHPSQAAALRVLLRVLESSRRLTRG